MAYARDPGFFFEPDHSKDLLKLSPMGGEFINTDLKIGVAHSPNMLEERGFMPANDERRMTLPSLTDGASSTRHSTRSPTLVTRTISIDYMPCTSSSVIICIR
ncbi:hypothetical protein F5Y10DRAFT_243577 [Nemania abortiva]|nr:hypothetical protein F5Y10DRAFT_243577 [Nemania abortiva]